MTTESQEQTATQEAPAPEAQDGASPDGATPEVDWKARAEQLEVDNAALVQRERTQKGRQRPFDEFSAQLQGLRDEIEAGRKATAAITQSVISGETESLPGQLAEATQQADQGRATAQWAQQHDNLLGQLEQALKDETGSWQFDLSAARKTLGTDGARYDDLAAIMLGTPELQEAAAQWNRGAPDGPSTAVGARNADALMRAFAETNQAVIKKVREKATVDTEKAKTEAAKAAREGVLRDPEVADMGTGPSAAGGSPPGRGDAFKGYNEKRYTDAQMRAWGFL